MNTGLRVLIAEDVDLLGDALEYFLTTRAGFDVVGRVVAGDEVLGAARRTRPDVALVDIQMPGRDGIEVCRELARTLPDVKVVIFTALPGPGRLQKALAAGASGYLLKTMSGDALAAAIAEVAAGKVVVDPGLAAEALRAGSSPLTERETDVLRLMYDGATTDAVAEELFLSTGTVRNYLSSAMAKLHANCRIDAVRVAHHRGLI